MPPAPHSTRCVNAGGLQTDCFYYCYPLKILSGFALNNRLPPVHCSPCLCLFFCCLNEVHKQLSPFRHLKLSYKQQLLYESMVFVWSVRIMPFVNVRT